MKSSHNKVLSVRRVLVLATAALVIAPPVFALPQDGAEVSSPASSRASTAAQKPNVPPAGQQAEDAVEQAVDRFRIGAEGGVDLDPELIIFGAHAAFAPIFTRNLEFRPGFEFGLGEVTTVFGVNFDLVYLLPGLGRGSRWTPYAGAGPNLSVSHRDFEDTDEESGNRFDFSDTDFDAGFNFIAGIRNRSGVFLEMKATAYSVPTIRLLLGYNF